MDKNNKISKLNPFIIIIIILVIAIIAILVYSIIVSKSYSGEDKTVIDTETGQVIGSVDIISSNDVDNISLITKIKMMFID